jgi:hypothetical protein
VRTTHRDRHAIVAPAHDLRDGGGTVVVERDRGDSNQPGSKSFHASLDLLGSGVREQQIQNFDLVTVRAQGCGEVGERHEQSRDLLEGVRRIDEKNAHEASSEQRGIA